MVFAMEISPKKIEERPLKSLFYKIYPWTSTLVKMTF